MENLEESQYKTKVVLGTRTDSKTKHLVYHALLDKRDWKKGIRKRPAVTKKVPPVNSSPVATKVPSLHSYAATNKVPSMPSSSVATKVPSLHSYAATYKVPSMPSSSVTKKVPSLPSSQLNSRVQVVLEDIYEHDQPMQWKMARSIQYDQQSEGEDTLDDDYIPSADSEDDDHHDVSEKVQKVTPKAKKVEEVIPKAKKVEKVISKAKKVEKVIPKAKTVEKVIPKDKAGKITFIDYLKTKESDEPIVIDVDAQKETNDDEPDPERDPAIVSLSTTTISFMANLDEAKRRVAAKEKRFNHRCQLCGYVVKVPRSQKADKESLTTGKDKNTADKESNIADKEILATHKESILEHLDHHVAALSQTLVGCDLCDALLPDKFICPHRQTHTEKHPAVPGIMERVSREIHNDLTYFLLQDFPKVKMHQVYKCRYCKDEFTSVDFYRSHFISQHTFKYVCKLCRKPLFSYMQMFQHLKQHKVKKVKVNSEGTFAADPSKTGDEGQGEGLDGEGEAIEVDDQDGEMSDQDEMPGGPGGETSAAKDDGQPHCNCPYCQSKFLSLMAVTTHIKSRHPDQAVPKFPCTRCSKTFYSPGHLQAHMPRHDRLFRCEHEGCSAYYTNKWTLGRHVKVKHEGEPLNKALCSLCGQSFHCQSRLREHEEYVHQGKELIKCSHCPATFNSMDTYKRHRKRHAEGEGQYVCEKCGERFKAASQFFGHKRTHNRPVFPCHACQKKFTHKESLEIHLVNKRHFTGDQPESMIRYRDCKICGMRMINGMQLGKHMDRIHGKPKICPYCGKKFNDRQNLKFHMKSHTKSHPSCEICDVVFRSKVKLEEHMGKVHGMGPAAATTSDIDPAETQSAVNSLPVASDKADNKSAVKNLPVGYVIGPSDKAATKSVVNSLPGRNVTGTSDKTTTQSAVKNQPVATASSVTVAPVSESLEAELSNMVANAPLVVDTGEFHHITNIHFPM